MLILSVLESSFEERLAAQRAEKEREEAEEKRLGFKKQLTKEEKIEKKKLRLAAIGELSINCLVHLFAMQLTHIKPIYAFY